MAKPRRWRRYWWYRPPSLTWTRSPKEVQQMDGAYIAWLSERRGWSVERTLAYVGIEAEKPAVRLFATPHPQPAQGSLYSDAA